MYNRCDICIEERCKKDEAEQSCDCDNCKHVEECDKWIRPTIRITTKCTQSCSHCCFECSPIKDTHMSIETVVRLAKFISNHPSIRSCNLMGGELFCHPEWRTVIPFILGTTALKTVRIVSNADWAADECCDEFVEMLARFKDKVYVAISNDQWHTNKNVERAAKLLKEAGVAYKVDDGEMVPNAIVPVGRSRFGMEGVYSMFGNYCAGPNKYQILIDEVGDVFKCAMGIWKYASIDDYLDGGFEARFKEFHKAFESVWIGSCTSCLRMHERSGR